MKVVKEEKDHHPSNLSFLGGNSVDCGNQTQVQNWARPTTWNLLKEFGICQQELQTGDINSEG